jgi:hypothetical protein
MREWQTHDPGLICLAAAREHGNFCGDDMRRIEQLFENWHVADRTFQGRWKFISPMVE